MPSTADPTVKIFIGPKPSEPPPLTTDGLPAETSTEPPAPDGTSTPGGPAGTEDDGTDSTPGGPESTGGGELGPGASTGLGFTRAPTTPVPTAFLAETTADPAGVVSAAASSVAAIPTTFSGLLTTAAGTTRIPARNGTAPTPRPGEPRARAASGRWPQTAAPEGG